MICCLRVDEAGSAAPDRLDAIARACSPRVESHGPDAIVFDVDGLSRVCGPPEIIARDVMSLASAEHLTVRVAIAGTATAAWVLAHARAGITIVAPGTEPAALADLPLGWLASVIDLDRTRQPAAASNDRRWAEGYRERFEILARWGIRTCGDLAILPRADVQARLGPVGVRLHQAARGEDVVPLVPAAEARVFADRLELEWPIDGLEPLSFVLARQCDRLSDALERADRGAVAITTRLTLVTRAVHERVLHLPAPLRDPRVLRTLILLDLESHPPPAAIDVVAIQCDVTPGRIVQGSLLARAVPSPEDLSTLLARLGALMGESRLGAPVLPDTHDARQIKQGVPGFGGAPGTWHLEPCTQFCLRRFRLPLAVRVTMERGTPIRVDCSAHGWSGGRVVMCAGPWRTSGGWWSLDRTNWDRDEWDVELAPGGLYRLARQRTTGGWEIEGIFD
jgi:protein ImuB